MGYRAALELAEWAKKLGVLGNEMVRDGIRHLAYVDDPDMAKLFEEEVGALVVETFMDGYRSPEQIERRQQRLERRARRYAACV